MVKSFIFRDMSYYNKSWKNDPNLQTIKEFFEINCVNLEEICWSHRAKLIKNGYTASYKINDCIKNVDFSSFSQSSKTIVLNGSGNYHQRTFFLVKYLNSPELSYIQLDAHTDFGNKGVHKEFVNSGGFIENIVDLKKIVKAYLLGLVPTEIVTSLGYNEGIGPFNRKFVPTDNPLIFNEKTELYLVDNYSVSAEQLSESKSQSFFKYKNRYRTLSQFEPGLIPTEDVYVSIDLDVIGEFPTGFRGLGNLSLEKVIKLIEMIGNSKNIIGADICGLDLNELRYEKKDKKALYLRQILAIYQTFSFLMKSDIDCTQSQIPILH